MTAAGLMNMHQNFLPVDFWFPLIQTDVNSPEAPSSTISKVLLFIFRVEHLTTEPAETLLAIGTFHRVAPSVLQNGYIAFWAVLHV